MMISWRTSHSSSSWCVERSSALSRLSRTLTPQMKLACPAQWIQPLCSLPRLLFLCHTSGQTDIITFGRSRLSRHLLSVLDVLGGVFKGSKSKVNKTVSISFGGRKKVFYIRIVQVHVCTYILGEMKPVFSSFLLKGKKKKLEKRHMIKDSLKAFPHMVPSLRCNYL